MPKSKRNKQIELAKTKKRGLDWKKRLFEEVRSCVDSYTNVFVFSVNDMRNSKMKNVREQWKHSRFFIGKNKIMAMALGRFAEEEYKPNLHKIGQQIKGQRGLLFSNKSTEEVLSWFRSYSEGDFARSGNTAIEDVKLAAGPLSQFPHNLEPYLRQLGLPTSLVKGVIHLVKDHEVCKTGDVLTPETAKILKLLGYEMAEFHITINCVWSQDGTFMQLTEDVDVNSKENLKKKDKKSNSLKVEETQKSPEVEAMEVIDSDEEEAPELVEGIHSDKEEAPELVEDIHSDGEEAPELVEDIHSDGEEVPELIEDTSYILPNIATNKYDSNSSPAKVSNSSTPKANKDNIEETCEIKVPVIVSPKEVIKTSEETPTVNKKKKVKESSDVNKEESDTRSRPRKRKANGKKAAARNDSLLKTPDPNTSQDSPIFRELRNRSVKVNKKRNK